MFDNSKFIGRRAKSCTKCGNDKHFVNRLGGIQCERCSPPKRDSDVVQRLRIDGGFWQDQAAERFEGVDLPPAANPKNDVPPVAVSDLIAPPVATHQHYLLRGPQGELSEAEINLFISDAVWDQPDLWITLRTQRRRAKV